MRILSSAVLALCCLTTLNGGEEATYVGDGKCKPCHIKYWKTWSETKHAHAYDRIANEADKEKCYKCHTTGYGKPGGFKDSESTPNLKNNQCENCHGPGSVHAAVKDPDKEKEKELKRKTIIRHPTACADCHNPHVKDKAAAAREAK